MAPPTPEELARALLLSAVPRPARSGEEEEFLARFWLAHLQPEPGEDPSSLAARQFEFSIRREGSPRVAGVPG